MELHFRARNRGRLSVSGRVLVRSRNASSRSQRCHFYLNTTMALVWLMGVLFYNIVADKLATFLNVHHVVNIPKNNNGNFFKQLHLRPTDWLKVDPAEPPPHFVRDAIDSGVISHIFVLCVRCADFRSQKFELWPESVRRKTTIFDGEYNDAKYHRTKQSHFRKATLAHVDIVRVAEAKNYERCTYPLIGWGLIFMEQDLCF